MSKVSNSISKLLPNGNGSVALETLIEWASDKQGQNHTTAISKKLKINGAKKTDLNYNALKGKKLHKILFKYRRNRLCHKLIRIQKEFHFVSKNIKSFQSLTRREKEIIRLLANGNNNLDIAEQLFISRCTVEQHRKNLNRKLKITSFTHLMRYSYAFDLV